MGNEYKLMLLLLIGLIIVFSFNVVIFADYFPLKLIWLLNLGVYSYTLIDLSLKREDGSTTN